MKIGIIGSGKIGGALARLFASVGHDVFISNSRGPHSLKDMVAALGPRVAAVTPEEAVAHGDVVVLALPWRNRQELPAAKLFEGKIVVDATNPYKPEGFGTHDLGDSTSSEEIAKHMPGARVVKAFNTIYYKTLAGEGKKSKDGRLAIFVAGDDEQAKHVVAKLIEDIAFAPVDTGSLRDGGRNQQPDSLIYNKSMTADEAHKILART
jgi:8-hydroxy-5-deazaflavin:NADPH oxidoreductase